MGRHLSKHPQGGKPRTGWRDTVSRIITTQLTTARPSPDFHHELAGTVSSYLVERPPGKRGRIRPQPSSPPLRGLIRRLDRTASRDRPERAIPLGADAFAGGEPDSGEPIRACERLGPRWLDEQD